MASSTLSRGEAIPEGGGEVVEGVCLAASVADVAVDAQSLLKILGGLLLALPGSEKAGDELEPLT
jgi:hypothetical protein